MANDKIMNVPQELLILGAAVKTGIIEALRNSTTYADIAKELSLNSRAVWIVIEALDALGHVTRHGEMVTLSEETQKLLYDPAAPNYVGFSFMHRYNMIQSWVHLPEVLVSGQLAPHDKDPENTYYFYGSHASWSRE